MTVLAAPTSTRPAPTTACSEGVIDHLRSVEGTKVAAVVRELATGDGRRKVSLRSTDGEVDVSASPARRAAAATVRPRG